MCLLSVQILDIHLVYPMVKVNSQREMKLLLLRANPMILASNHGHPSKSCVSSVSPSRVSFEV